mmetsp:Transcript_45914/g.82677  ORF Transcript_45914/g.82677 Transcript_45914/m.82677 type:complete len:320 (-) Transcript_45914:303-1262(-)|eukprot:CAMPEP_0197656664 /NCGR_PEP_ID=MMETSP1338-20131121/42791_1 /TAXON_ID=43686 ORGANISM="Pelagodinium beii, Strain RCC1491" /NCGR_SAMPLE_ID=MMETSP1338 /ASSEMBLY_ACC=CAM_ASM_000754 /LENGTH=319 /DNA_ID=CAMNT_0043232765 /DNA_START=61 /DNA_END=1020 /DNA_ORIENTATION=+
MTSDTESQEYQLIEEKGPCFKLWHKALLAFFITAGAVAQTRPVAQTGPAEPTELTASSLEVFAEFEGSSPQYAGYGLTSEGHFSATLQPHDVGSKTTAFLLDHRFEYVVSGEIQITDGTGRSYVGKAGDLFFLAYGSNVTHYARDAAVTYSVVADEAPPLLPEDVEMLEPEAYRKWVKESGRATQISHFSQIKDRRDKVFGDISHLFFDALGCFRWNTSHLQPWGKVKSPSSPTWNFCCGVFHLESGPPSFTSGKYKDHEEIDFIIDGKFQYATDTQKFHVKEGDLVHNPRHLDVSIETSTSGAFLSVSLSPLNDFFPN